MRNKFASIGILFGGVSLILALVHFWAGPFSTQPTIESVVVEKAASIRKAAVDAIKGKEVKSTTSRSKIDADRITRIVTAVLGGLALILAALSLANHESLRAAGGAASLGVAGIAFQFIAMYAMALLVVLLIVGTIASLKDIA